MAGEFSAGIIFHGENFPCGGKLQGDGGGELLGKVISWGTFSEFQYEIIFIGLALSLPTQFYARRY